MDRVMYRLAGLARKGAALSALLYVLLHLLLVAALVSFGRVAGGYPLAAPAIAVYGVAAVAGAGLALWAGLRAGTPEERLEPLLALAVFLAGALAGAFFSTPILSALGQRAEYAPYLDDDGGLVFLNLWLAAVVLIVALVARRRRLLVAGMIGQALALLLNPGLVLLAVRLRVVPDTWALLALPALYLGGATALGLRLRGWAGGEASRAGGGLAASGAGLALVAGVWAASWRYLGPARGLGDNWLPEAGRTLGWIGRTVPQGAYGPAGTVLSVLKAAFPWLLGVVALIWLAAALLRAARLGVRGTLRAAGFPGGLATAGLAVLWQSPLPLMAYGAGAPLVHGLAGALPAATGQEWLDVWLFPGYALLGLALVGISAPLRDARSEGRGRLTLAATMLVIAAAAVLTLGLWAGTVQSIEAQGSLTVPEYRQAAQLRLALSLPVNAVLALAAWATALAGLRALVTGPAALPGQALGRGLALAGVLAVAGGVAFWQLTAMPIAETSPVPGAVDVPTNAPIVVRLRPGLRNWGPGIIATYAGNGETILGTTGGSGAGETYFAPDGGWRPNARVNVRVLSPVGLRAHTFSFATAAGPSADVAPLPGPGPAPTPTRAAGFP